MTYGQQGAGQPDSASSQESFLGGFTRVPNGLEPTEVYSYFLRLTARLHELEERARQTSAPFVLEAALREAAEIRSQHAAAAERTYNEMVSAAQQESAGLRGTAQRQADEALYQARAQAEETLSSARAQAEQLEREAAERTEQAEAELERLCVDYASFLQRLLERRKGQAGTAPVAAMVGAAPVPTPAPGPAPVAPARGDEYAASAPAAPAPAAPASGGPAGGDKDEGYRVPSWLE